MTKILRIDASARHDDSISRRLADRLVARFPGAEVTTRDLTRSLPHLDEGFTTATFTPPEARSPAQNAALSLSDQLLGEVQAADILVISTPIYNFSIPSALKAWIDQITRFGLVFHYTDTGPEGLLTGKRAFVLAASGGTEIGAANDFATPYLHYVLGFMGITDVTTLGAATMNDADAAIAAAQARLDALDLAA